MCCNVGRDCRVPSGLSEPQNCVTRSLGADWTLLLLNSKTPKARWGSGFDWATWTRRMPFCVSHHPSVSSDDWACLALPQPVAPEHSSCSKIFLLGCVPGGWPLLQLLNSSCHRCTSSPGVAHSGSEWWWSPAVHLGALNLPHCSYGPCWQLKKVLCVSLSLSHFLINFVLLLEDRLKVIRRRTTVAFSLYWHDVTGLVQSPGFCPCAFSQEAFLGLASPAFRRPLSLPRVPCIPAIPFFWFL